MRKLSDSILNLSRTVYKIENFVDKMVNVDFFAGINSESHA